MTFPIPTEEQWQATIIELAKWLRYRTYHTHDSRRSTAGFPDLVLVRPPRLIFVELKSRRGSFTKAQRAWLALLGDTPAEVYEWREGSISVEQIVSILTPTTGGSLEHPSAQQS